MLNRDYQIKTLCCDTKYRKNYINTIATNCELHMPFDLKNVTYMALASVEFPNSYYVFSAEDKTDFIYITTFTGEVSGGTPLPIYSSNADLDFNGYDYTGKLTQLKTDFIRKLFVEKTMYSKESKSNIEPIRYMLETTKYDTTIKKFPTILYYSNSLGNDTFTVYIGDVIDANKITLTLPQYRNNDYCNENEFIEMISTLLPNNIDTVLSNYLTTINKLKVTINIKYPTEIRYRTSIPSGNYSAEQFTEKYTVSLTSAFGDTSGFVVTVDYITGKISITASVYFNIESVAENIDFRNSMAWRIGYRQLFYYGKKKYTTESVYNAENLNLFFSIDDGIVSGSKSNEIVIVTDNSYITDNVISKIVLKNGLFQINFADAMICTLQKRFYDSPVTIKKLKIKILNEDGTVADLHGTNFTFSLEIGMLRQNAIR